MNWPTTDVLDMVGGIPNIEEAYWLKVIAAQAAQAFNQWADGQSVDADMLCIEKHLKQLCFAQARAAGGGATR